MNILGARNYIKIFIWFRSNMRRENPPREKSRSQFTLESDGDLGTDLYYNSRPESRHHQTSTVSICSNLDLLWMLFSFRNHKNVYCVMVQLDRRIGGWTYTPQPGILEHHLKQTGYQSNFDKSYPKTLESLAEKVDNFIWANKVLSKSSENIFVESNIIECIME